MAQSQTDEVIDSGHSYAMLLSGSGLVPEGGLVECFAGLEQVMTFYFESFKNCLLLPFCSSSSPAAFMSTDLFLEISC